MNKLIKEGKFNYIEIGNGKPIIILHGLMGGLSNFAGVSDYFPKIGYKVIIPQLPIYELELDLDFQHFSNNHMSNSFFDQASMRTNHYPYHNALYQQYKPAF